MTKSILCLDFDGVIHSYTSGWKGADVIPDPPVEGAMAFVAEAVNHFRVAVFSSRSNQPGGMKAMIEWMHRNLCAHHQGDGHDIFDLIEWPLEKPAAFVTIDDRAITFTGVWPDMATLKNFKPWNKKG
jgi:hypothetical protein